MSDLDLREPIHGRPLIACESLKCSTVVSLHIGISCGWHWHWLWLWLWHSTLALALAFDFTLDSVSQHSRCKTPGQATRRRAPSQVAERGIPDRGQWLAEARMVVAHLFLRHQAGRFTLTQHGRRIGTMLARTRTLAVPGTAFAFNTAKVQ